MVIGKIIIIKIKSSKLVRDWDRWMKENHKEQLLLFHQKNIQGACGLGRGLKCM